jgi:prepilin-type N-terminal cleavage/methylation domain-containing protein
MTWIRRLRGEQGMSLAELLVAMSIMSIVVVAFASVLSIVQKGVSRQDSLSETLNQTRLAVQELDREMRSGNVLYDPSLENAAAGVSGKIASCSGCLPGYTLRVYTQSNANSRAVAGSNGYRCVLWKIANQQVMTRWWPPLDPSSPSGWRVVATGIVNQSLSLPAFTLDQDPLKLGRTLNVLYAANENLARYPTQTARVQASLTGRNTSYGYPANVCLQTPSG